MAAIRSRKLRASPVPTLKMPDTDGASRSQRITATVSSTKMKSRFCSPSATPSRCDLNRRTGLPALVIFVRAEHVEEFEAGALRRQLRAVGKPLGHGKIEQMLAEAVEVHRLLISPGG